MNRKGIILAGGSGSRLYPLTRVISKQLLPVYDKPMVYYPLSVLMLLGIREILVISTPRDLPLYERLLGDGQQLGIQFVYQSQETPDGVASALTLADEFLDGAPSCLILGDNILYGHELIRTLQLGNQRAAGATIFGYQVAEPGRYGVVEFDENRRVLSIEEKPAQPKSNHAVPGVYFYDNKAPAYARDIPVGPRGEKEITSLHQRYLAEGQLHVELLGRGIAWLDAGTHDSLIEASKFIEVIQHRQGLRVGCLEEIAWRQNFIDSEQLATLAKQHQQSDYGQYLQSLIK